MVSQVWDNTSYGIIELIHFILFNPVVLFIALILFLVGSMYITSKIKK